MNSKFDSEKFHHPSNDSNCIVLEYKKSYSDNSSKQAVNLFFLCGKDSRKFFKGMFGKSF